MAGLKEHATELVREASVATVGAPNEASLRHELEKALESHCRALGFPWVPFQLEIPVRSSDRSRTRFVDVAHGGVVIEYEPPRVFRDQEGAAVVHARGQAEGYARLLHEQEGRSLDQYVLVAWDGAHITFGRFSAGIPDWERLTRFEQQAAQRLLRALRTDGIPLVHPKLLSQVVGPESEHGSALIPVLFQAARTASSPGAPTSKTALLFTEWRRLFGQVVGIQSEKLRGLLGRQGEAHGERYELDPTAYLFALNTYIALVAKLVAALSLRGGSEDLRDHAVPIGQRIEALESGRLFKAGGVLNMLAGDFFSWYRDDSSWATIGPRLDTLIGALGELSFDVARKSPDSTRDLFKGIYQSFVPRALRHALGEYYTPDWLAAHALDALGWEPEKPLLDPTCGSGTFLLEALRRRMIGASASHSAAELLDGLYGIDLNPLAVLTARASLIVSLAPNFNPEKPLSLPVYLADAINPAEAEGVTYRHSLQTEVGPLEFCVPHRLVESPGYFEMFARLRELVDEGWSATRIETTLHREFSEVAQLDEQEQEAFKESVQTLVNLNNRGWDGIWCSILADRFAAGSIPRVAFIAGNPPWVKWSHLPPEYAEFIKPRCLDLGVFSRDRWVGGIESDISTVITYEVIDKWLAPGGSLAFFITGTVFANESSQGFRRFELQHRHLQFKLLRVEDFSEVAPFEGVSNFATLMLLTRDKETTYPVPYRVWHLPGYSAASSKVFPSVEEFRSCAIAEDLVAQPVPGTDAGPWIKGTREEQKIWDQIFAPGARAYVARKGITPDRNGIFFVEALALAGKGLCTIQNDPGMGRTAGIPKVRAAVEREHLYPLLRGRGVRAFSATPDPRYHVLLPQRAMHGDPDLPIRAPETYRFLRRFKSELEQRSSYRRFQSGQPWWSVWSTGPYTFSTYKVLWREMPGGRFVAAYIGSYEDPLLGNKIVVPDHKLYFVPLENEWEAAFLTAFLNAPIVSRAVSAYAAQLSLGVSVVEYLAIPQYDHDSPTHRRLAELGREISRQHRVASPPEQNELDQLSMAITRQ